MGYYVGVNLWFSANSMDGLLASAAETLEHFKEESEFSGSYTETMLEMVRGDVGRYIHQGNKGDSFVWSGVWNYYRAEDEVPYLKYFLRRCWEFRSGISESVMFDFDRALLLVEKEGSESVDVYEFSFDESSDSVSVRETCIPDNFCTGQM
mgnify:CR=1 FL=1